MDSYWKLRFLPFLETALPFVRFGFLVCVLACAVIATYDIGWRLLAHHLTLLDFTVFWTAARFEHVYDTVAFTRAQLELSLAVPDDSFIRSRPPASWMRPFPYPPTALLFVLPLRWLSFVSAAMVWTAGGITAFLFASRLYGRAGLLAIIAPMAALSVLAGQATLLFGAALSAGVALAERRPALAGILFGLVGAIKPTLGALVPIALLVSGNRRALIASIAMGMSIIFASLFLGPSLWIEWMQSLPAFLAQVTPPEAWQSNVAPGLWFAPLGLLTVVYVFRTNRSPDVRLLALVSGTACCTPYMMGYDMAIMAPAAAALMLERNPFGWMVGAITFAFAFLHLVPEIAVGVCLLVALQSRMAPQLAQLDLRQFTRVVGSKFDRHTENECP